MDITQVPVFLQEDLLKESFESELVEFLENYPKIKITIDYVFHDSVRIYIENETHKLTRIGDSPREALYKIKLALQKGERK